MNKKVVVSKLRKILLDALEEDKERVDTKIPNYVKNRCKEKNRKHSEKKRRRDKVIFLENLLI